MSKQQRRNIQTKPQSPPLARIFLASKTIVVAAFLTGALSGISTVWILTVKAKVPGTNGQATKAITFAELIEKTPEQLAGVDIAEMNLLCAQGLPGAETLDIGKCRATLDQWATKVRETTEHHLYRVHDPQYADHYKHSEAILRMEMLVQVLQEDFGVHYNPQRAKSINFANSKDLFIHGLIDDTNGGTCISMPVLYTAVARRLGYPVKIAEAKQHLFCRWEGRGERWNVEATASGGMDSYPDDHYRKWPKPISDEEMSRSEYLKSLSPSEELAVFLATRGHCLVDTGHLHNAQLCYAHAHALHPTSHDYFGFFFQSVRREMAMGGPVFAAGSRLSSTTTMRLNKK